MEFYKSIKDIQAIQKKPPQAVKQIYNRMIDILKREIQKICKSSQYIYTGNRSPICDQSRAGVVCRDIGEKILAKVGPLSLAIREVESADWLNINNFTTGLSANAATTAAKRRDQKDG